MTCATRSNLRCNPPLNSSNGVSCLITAIAELGVKTSLSEVGSGHLAIVVIETLALLAFAVFLFITALRMLCIAL